MPKFKHNITIKMPDSFDFNPLLSWLQLNFEFSNYNLHTIGSIMLNDKKFSIITIEFKNEEDAMAFKLRWI